MVAVPVALLVVLLVAVVLVDGTRHPLAVLAGLLLLWWLLTAWPRT